MRTRMHVSAHDRFAKNLRDAIARGGLQGGAPEGDDASKAAVAKELAEAQARARAAEEQVAKFKADEAKRAADAKAKEDAEAVEKGKHKELLAAREADLAAQKAALEAATKTIRAGIEKKAAKLPEVAKKQYDLLKDSLTPEKLDGWLETMLEGATPAAKAPDALTTGGGKKKDGEHKLHPETLDILREHVPEVAMRIEKEVGKRIGSFEISKGGDHKFRWGGHEDDRQATVAFIDLMNHIARGKRDALFA